MKIRPSSVSHPQEARKTRERVSRLLLTLAFAAAAHVVGTPALHAQDNCVAGHVRALGTSEPLQGAQIIISGAPRATTDAEGRFRITGLTGTSVALDVRRIGYRNERVTARVGQQD